MTTLATDDFNRADSASLGANWTEDPNNAMAISGNKLVSPSDTSAYYTGVAFPNDQWAQAVLNGGDGGGIALRGTAGNTHYVVNIEGGFGVGVSLVVARFNAGVFTGLDSQSVTFNSGDVLYAQIVGDTITAKRNGSALGTPVVDGTPIASGSPGLFGFGAFAADDFAAGDFTSPTTIQLMGQIVF